MALASLGFSGGPSVVFRLNPSQIDWSFKVHTSVTDTVGGRVVQITGATLSDLTVIGMLGEDRSRGPGAAGQDHPGASWRLAEAFVAQCRKIMVFQAKDATETGLMQRPATFSYPARGWRWQVYLKAIDEVDGAGSLEHRAGKFSHGYKLTLFPVQTGSDALVKAGQSLGGFQAAQAQAIQSYIERISSGVGWKQSEFNGGLLDQVTKGGSG